MENKIITNLVQTAMIYAYTDTKMEREAIEKVTSELNPSRTTPVVTID